MRELSNGVSRSESEQNHSVPHSRERSISPHHLRRIDRGSKTEDSIEVELEKHMLFTMATQTMQDNLKTTKGYLEIADQSPLPNHINTHMDLLIWNCRGAGNKKFKRNLRELVLIHKPDLMVLMETKVNLASMGTFFNQMGFMTLAHVDLIGQSRGI
ncbi:hypothetical protein LOK49_LG06G00526 [Camellia lanceoleosa]|uniref:Uncharacterized protein n=1 Tax=Camellia lanceoleosa TaxID=1840588 RepID=A0ACC0H9H8_9ERIC|nr:hypothetical protein LOK49_LG06G00526 [Camellia lanceoleosa]